MRNQDHDSDAHNYVIGVNTHFCAKKIVAYREEEEEEVMRYYASIPQHLCSQIYLDLRERERERERERAVSYTHLTLPTRR